MNTKIYNKIYIKFPRSEDVINRIGVFGGLRRELNADIYLNPRVGCEKKWIPFKGEHHQCFMISWCSASCYITLWFLFSETKRKLKLLYIQSNVGEQIENLRIGTTLTPVSKIRTSWWSAMFPDLFSPQLLFWFSKNSQQ